MERAERYFEWHTSWQRIMLFWFSHCYCYCFCFCFCCCNWYCTIVMLLMLLLSLSLLIKSGKSKMIENNNGINHHLNIIVEELFIIVVIKLTLLKCKYCNIVDDDIDCRSCWNIDNVFPSDILVITTVGIKKYLI